MNDIIVPFSATNTLFCCNYLKYCVFYLTLVRRFDMARASQTYMQLRSILHIKKLSRFQSHFCFFVLVRSRLVRYCSNKTRYCSKISVEREMRSAVSNITPHFLYNKQANRIKYKSVNIFSAVLCLISCT